jgi:hypothetical protein
MMEEKIYPYCKICQGGANPLVASCRAHHVDIQ